MQIGGDQYNRIWDGAYLDGEGLTESDCDEIMNDPVDLESHAQLQEKNRRACYDCGHEDG